IVFFMNFGAVLALLFANSFLNLKDHLPRARKILITLITLNLLNTILVFFSYQLALNLVVFGIGSMVIFVLLSGFLCWRKGARQARFFIVAWFFFLFGVLISLLADAGMITLNSFTRNVW